MSGRASGCPSEGTMTHAARAGGASAVGRGKGVVGRACRAVSAGCVRFPEVRAVRRLCSVSAPVGRSACG
ncbi:hypothetical protein HGI15_11865 [Modestobacter lapidis]|nr:hypothetical protein [Modestobacter lapidis]